MSTITDWVACCFIAHYYYYHSIFILIFFVSNSIAVCLNTQHIHRNEKKKLHTKYCITMDVCFGCQCFGVTVARSSVLLLFRLNTFDIDIYIYIFLLLCIVSSVMTYTLVLCAHFIVNMLNKAHWYTANTILCMYKYFCWFWCCCYRCCIVVAVVIWLFNVRHIIRLWYRSKILLRRFRVQ